ncbi:hypothetical protein VTK73DRAFT_4301 [Phialemonium thermophilum]|uniref:Uncharacterized protein n=1 Tax=Phialemonium thermophilum TaxID=223376 RepID=A0ABR3V9L4_9PEZI
MKEETKKYKQRSKKEATHRVPPVHARRAAVVVAAQGVLQQGAGADAVADDAQLVQHGGDLGGLERGGQGQGLALDVADEAVDEEPGGDGDDGEADEHGEQHQGGELFADADPHGLIVEAAAAGCRWRQLRRLRGRAVPSRCAVCGVCGAGAQHEEITTPMAMGASEDSEWRQSTALGSFHSKGPCAQRRRRASRGWSESAAKRR